MRACNCYRNLEVQKLDMDQPGACLVQLAEVFAVAAFQQSLERSTTIIREVHNYSFCEYMTTRKMMKASG